MTVLASLGGADRRILSEPIIVRLDWQCIFEGVFGLIPHELAYRLV